MLKREIGKWDLVLLLVNSFIGAGIFGLPSKIYALSAWYSIPAILITAAIVLILILNFSEVGSRFTKTGGPYLYTLKAFGRFPAFLMGWLLLITRLATYAALINLLPAYLGFFYPELAYGLGKTAIILVITIFFTYINYRGVKDSTRWNNGFTIGKIIPLALFVIVGFIFLDPHLISIPTAAPDFNGISQSVFLLIFAFTGFEAIIVSTGEIKEPQKNIPFALIVSLLFVAGFYSLIQIVSVGTLAELADSDKPLAEAAFLMMGKPGAVFITIGAVISISGTLNTVMLIGARVPFALAEERQLPKGLAKVHSKYSTPSNSLLLFATIAFLVSVTGTFIYAITISVISKVMIFFIVSATLLRFRQIRKEQTNFFKLRFGYLFGWLGMGLSLLLLLNAKIEEFRDVAITLVFGVFVWLLNELWNKKGQSPNNQ